MKLHLYEFSYLDNKEWVLSTLSGEEVRQSAEIWDHGGTNTDLFYDTFKYGIIRILTKIEDIESQYRDYIPYCSCEQIFDQRLNGYLNPRMFLYLEIDMKEYFEEYFDKDFLDS